MNEHINQHQLASQLVLASSSPRRKELVALLDLSLPVSVFSVDTDERILASWSPAEAVQQLSLNKAAAVIDAILTGKAPISVDNRSLILTADTIVVVDGDIIGKPASEREARATLKRLQGRSHQVYTGLALMPCSSNGLITAESLEAYKHTVYTFGSYGQYELLHNNAGALMLAKGYSYSNITFHAMSDTEIDGYVQTKEPLDKAGSYGVQGIGSIFIEKIEGDFYSVMGLPLNLLYQMLLSFGISPFKS